jgi:hypothetical protein
MGHDALNDADINFCNGDADPDPARGRRGGRAAVRPGLQLAHAGFAEGQLIFSWEMLPSEVARPIHPHPSQSEAIGETHLALAGKPLHVHA